MKRIKGIGLWITVVFALYFNMPIIQLYNTSNSTFGTVPNSLAFLFVGWCLLILVSMFLSRGKMKM